MIDRQPAPPLPRGLSERTPMRHDLMDILACPLCHGPLTIIVTQEEAAEVIAGTLTCAACRESYPIAEGIPNLLPPDLRRAMEQESATPAPGSDH